MRWSLLIIPCWVALHSINNDGINIDSSSDTCLLYSRVVHRCGCTLLLCSTAWFVSAHLSSCCGCSIGSSSISITMAEMTGSRSSQGCVTYASSSLQSTGNRLVAPCVGHKLTVNAIDFRRERRSTRRPRTSASRTFLLVLAARAL